MDEELAIIIEKLIIARVASAVAMICGHDVEIQEWDQRVTDTSMALHSYIKPKTRKPLGFQMKAKND